MIFINYNHVLVFISLFIHLQLSGAVGKNHCLTGEPITLDCHFKVPSGTRRENVSVLWQFEGSRAQLNKSTLFEFKAGNITQHSLGYDVNVNELLKGNAPLHLVCPAVTDEGRFSCVILVKPENYATTVTLHVSARPTLSLTEHATVLNGQKTTLSCEITGFYPEHLEIQWLRQLGHKNEPVEVDVCTESPMPNPDHTYSQKSHMTIQGNKTENHGAVYICQIKHRSFNTPQSKTVRLSVVETPQNPVVLIAVTVVSSLVLVSLILGAAVIGYLYLHKVPPSISDINTPSVIYANTRADIKCTISRVNPKYVNVQWYMVLPHDPGNHDPPWGALNTVSLEPLEGQALFSESGERKTLSLEDLTEHLRLHSDDTRLVSVLSLCPTVSDDGGRYRCMVTYKGQTYTRETTLSVKTQPSFLQISSAPQIPVLGQQLVLCCRMERFYPAQVQLEWWGPGGERLLGPVVQYGPFSDYQGLHSVWSTTELTITTMEEGLVYTCRAYHSSFPEPGYQDLPYRVNLKGTPPTLKFIKCDPARPQVGQECSLSLCVEDFSPNALSVSWFRNGEPVPTGFSPPRPA
ncbi:uncharacterized protein LOC125302316 [Alosa alosa]|uniref:uncharacterized protein LOC125302316 n=1 Tax=Alosa alosa TaxID=278164 RepID=UPI0020153846|nr:uncharacterized protein LOC125302316 [Alosa alosa]